MNKSLSLRTYEAFHSFMYHLRTNPLVLVVGVFAIAFEFVAWFFSSVLFNILLAPFKAIAWLSRNAPSLEERSRGQKVYTDYDDDGFAREYILVGNNKWFKWKEYI